MSPGENVARVRAFVAAWNRRDGEAIVAAFADNVVYHNVPMTPNKGKVAVSAVVARLLSEMSDVRWEIVHIAETADGSVLTERVDYFEIRRRSISVPVMGVFEFRDGLITRWSDYFDLGQYQAQLSGES
jgi:limonene-1,2-epoxide hydrolase